MQLKYEIKFDGSFCSVQRFWNFDKNGYLYKALPTKRLVGRKGIKTKDRKIQKRWITVACFVRGDGLNVFFVTILKFYFTMIYESWSLNFTDLPQNELCLTFLAYSETSLGLYQTSMMALFPKNI